MQEKLEKIFVHQTPRFYNHRQIRIQMVGFIKLGKDFIRTNMHTTVDNVNPGMKKEIYII